MTATLSTSNAEPAYPSWAWAKTLRGASVVSVIQKWWAGQATRDEQLFLASWIADMLPELALLADARAGKPIPKRRGA